MKFAGDKSHVRRLTKADVKPKKEGGMFTVAEKRKQKISPSKEQYIVTQDYTDPFEGKKYKKGDVLSNRQGRNVQAQERGNYQSYSQYNRIWSPKARRASADVKDRDSWIRASANKTGRSPNAIRQDPEFRQAWTEFSIISKHDRKNKSPTSPLAKILVAAGLRDPNAKYNVGDTPDRKKKGKK